MRRIYPWTILLALAAVLVWTSAAHAQAQGDDDDDTMTFDVDDVNEPKPEPEPEPEPVIDEPVIDEPAAEPDLEADLADTGPVKVEQEVALGEDRVSWKDIVVVVRKPFLKVRRWEAVPSWGVTMNDNILQHFQFTAQINRYLTDALAVGLEGHIFTDRTRESFDNIRRQSRRLPTLNKYNYGGALNFHYVPIYGKFAVLDKHIIHWESFLTAGVGVTESEVIPRDPAHQPFKNILITPNVGASMRFFLTKFLTVNIGIRDYIYVDKFEAVGRTEVDGDEAQANASSALINNVLFQAGISFWLPTSFEYTTFR